MRHVEVSVQPIDRFAPLLGEAEVEELKATAKALGERLRGNVVWNVNSTERGGGVAELLRSLVGYARGTGIDARWSVISGPPEFFELTKRIHHGLHGSSGDGRPLDAAASELYRRVLHENLLEFAQFIRPGDVVILHDPQTIGLAEDLRKLGARVVWRCHVGVDRPNEEVKGAWAFLAPFLAHAETFIFSRRDYIPPFIDRARAVVVMPSIDPFSSKNQDLSPETVRAIVVHTGLVEGPLGTGTPVFKRDDGTFARVDRFVDVMRLGPAPGFDCPLVTQVSRWDRLKDPIGVLRGFARMLDAQPSQPAFLVLAGPNVHAVADDPEGAQVFQEVLAAWRALPHHHRARVSLVNLPMIDVEENAAIVNALQRHSAVVVQKSLHEGFGLTVTEAMWKGRPVLASAVGGIRDQIEHGRSGILLANPSDLAAFAEELGKLLANREQAEELGRNARERVRTRFLGLHSLVEYAKVVYELLNREKPEQPQPRGEALHSPSAP